MKCQACEYEWKTRVKEPKACPRCKTRLDWFNDKNNKNKFKEK